MYSLLCKLTTTHGMIATRPITQSLFSAAAIKRDLRVPAESGYLVEVILSAYGGNGLREAFALEGDTAGGGVQVVLLPKKNTWISHASLV